MTIEKPKQLANPSMREIRNVAQEVLDFYDSDDFHEDRVSDYDVHLAETIMQIIFGRDVFKWINDQLDYTDND